MNLLKALFNQDIEDAAFFDETYPLMDDFLRSEETLAVVKNAIEPGKLGHVNFHGVRWRASCDRTQTITVGTQVRVLGRRANILVVAPLEQPVFAQPCEKTLNPVIVMP